MPDFDVRRRRGEDKVLSLSEAIGLSLSGKTKRRYGALFGNNRQSNIRIRIRLPTNDSDLFVHQQTTYRVASVHQNAITDPATTLTGPMILPLLN